MAPTNPWHSLACSCVTAFPTSVFTVDLSSLCVCPLPFIRTLVIAFGTHPNPVQPHLNWLYLQRLAVQPSCILSGHEFGGGEALFNLLQWHKKNNVERNCTFFFFEIISDNIYGKNSIKNSCISFTYIPQMLTFYHTCFTLSLYICLCI